MRHILVMGVCGVGKSSVATAIASAMGAPFVEADAYHSPENVAHMQAGRPLTDEMRRDWLAVIGQELAQQSEPAVLACSALKQSYRDQLVAQVGEMTVIHLHGSQSLLEARVAARPDHFMPPSLVQSQLDVLEPPTGPGTLTLDVALPLSDVVTLALDFARRRGGGGR